MPSYGNVAVSERFENSNLFPLQADQPADYNIEQKSRNGEKNQRQQDSHRLELLNFLRNQVMRELIIPGIRTLASVTRQKEIHTAYHILNLSVRSKFKRQIIKNAVHIICGSQCSLTHPHHSATHAVGANHPR